MSARPQATPRAPRWAWLLLVTGLVLTGLAGGTVLGGWLLVDRWERAVGTGVLLDPIAREPSATDPGAGEPTAPGRPARSGEPEPGPARSGQPGGQPRSGEPAPPDGTEPGPDRDGGGTAVRGPLTYLVIGSDRRAGNPAAGERADAVILVHLPAGLREAYLISVPRDLRVPIPGHRLDKINAAYQLGGGGSGGARLLSATLHGVTGIGFDGAAILDFGGFREVVDALGGVEICLDREIRSIHTDEVFPAGCTELSGAQALDLARQRYDLPAGDLDRGRNHQRLIRAMLAEAAGAGLLTDPLRLDRTIRAVGDALTVDTGGVPLAELAYALRHLRPDRVTGITLPSYPQMLGGTSYVLADAAADGLYRAVRDSRLGAWAADHPRWRNG